MQNQCYPDARGRKITQPSPILAVHAAANAFAHPASANSRRAPNHDHEAVVVFYRALNDKPARNKLRNLKPLHRPDPQPESEPNWRLDFIKYESDPNSDPLARERGEAMGRAIERAQRLDKEIQAITSAGPLMRLYVVATDFDPEVARSTLDNYEPAEPLSIGALTAGGLAALWGWAAARLIAWPFSRRSRLRAASAQSGTANAE